ncbi:DUF3152 domain-containing protein [Spiractinospora alimapuensis]|uniref:DUF3152 domain-containing protein n=1 Tax=Spiractinospora alimapuensis TaxID=2820884 RepID=UPI003741F715
MASARRARQRGSRRRRLDASSPVLPLGLAAVAAALGVLTLFTPPTSEVFPPSGEGEGSIPSPSPEPNVDENAEVPPEDEEVDDSDKPVLLRSVVEEVDSASGDLTVVPGEGEKSGDGPLNRYAVEFEDGLPGEPEDFADAVEEILSDPRSWGGENDEMSFQRVDEGPVDFRVALSSPETTDRLCAPLSTNGQLSCHQGGRATINQNRWVSGVEHFDDDIETYRTYVINHEVGHALGHGHVNCPGEGEVAPVMQQQTISLDGCEANGWVNP